MLTEAKARQLVATALDYGKRKASGLEVSVDYMEESTARFANSGMTHHLQNGGLSVSIRAIVDGGRSAVQSSDDLTRTGIHTLVDKAIANAKLLKHDRFTYELLEPMSPRVQDNPKARQSFDPRIVAITAEDRLKAVEAIIKVAKRRRLTTAGIYMPSVSACAVANSKGLFRFYQETGLECSISMLGSTSSGWFKSSGASLDDIDPSKMAEIAAQRAVQSRDPIYLRPGEYTVVLEPEAALDMLGYLWGDLTGESHREETSVFTGEIGERVLGTNITVRDDVYHRLQGGCPFDDEGMTRTAVTLIENGIIRQPVKGRRNARKLGGAPTGHGSGMPGAKSEYPVNLVVSGSSRLTTEDLIASTDYGIWVPRFWYNTMFDPNTLLLSGMTRDGAMLIKDGKLTRGVKNMRFNISILEALRNVEKLGKAVFASGEDSFPAVVPSMKVRQFRFTSRTKTS
jgi:PmbA protein